MQLNVSKKQREMVLLEESLHAMRSRFNGRFLSLRSIKREILATVAADNRRLREIDEELGAGRDGGGKSFVLLSHLVGTLCSHLDLDGCLLSRNSLKKLGPFFTRRAKSRQFVMSLIIVVGSVRTSRGKRSSKGTPSIIRLTKDYEYWSTSPPMFLSH